MPRFSRLTRFVLPRLGRPIVPGTYRANFLHLYLDIAWFAITAATAMSFIGIFLTRQGASAFQLGLLSAGPGVVSLLASSFAGRWLGQRPLEKAVLHTAVLTRLNYVAWVLLPFFFAPAAQVWSVLGLTVLANIPGTALNIGFNNLFAEAVPDDWRAHVAGRRNALYAIIFIVATLLAGWILNTLPFPAGYQVIFVLGVVGAAMSTLHLGLIRLRRPEMPAPDGDSGLPADTTGALQSEPAVVAEAPLVLEDAPPATPVAAAPRQRLRPDVLRGPFGRVLTALFFFHMTLYLPSALFPLHMVNNLQLTDSQISLGTALFYVAMLVGSLLLSKLTRRWGNQKVTAMGAMLIGGYPFVMALGRDVWGFMASSPFGGLGWGLAGGAMINWLLERVAPEKRAASLVWYNMAINAAMLIGSMMGSAGGDVLGVRNAMLIAGGMRMLAGLYMLVRG